MNKKNEKAVNDLIDKRLHPWWDNLKAKYGLGKKGKIEVIFYQTSFCEPLDDGSMLSDARIMNTRAAMTTITVYFDKNHSTITDVTPGDVIIHDFKSKIYMSFQNLFEVIIDCELDLDKAEECLKHMLRHELGHIIVFRREIIGKTVAEIKERNKMIQNGYDRFPRARLNASNKSHWKNTLKYMELPWEKDANDAVGITMDDIREQFIRLNGPIK